MCEEKKSNDPYLVIPVKHNNEQSKTIPRVGVLESNPHSNIELTAE